MKGSMEEQIKGSKVEQEKERVMANLDNF